MITIKEESLWLIDIEKLISNKESTKQSFFDLILSNKFIQAAFEFSNRLKFPEIFYDLDDKEIIYENNFMFSNLEYSNEIKYHNTIRLTTSSNFDFSNKEKSLFKEYYKNIFPYQENESLNDEQKITFIRTIQETVFKRFYKLLSKKVYPELLQKYMTKVPSSPDILNGNLPYDFYSKNGFIKEMYELIQSIPYMFENSYIGYKSINVDRLISLLEKLPENYTKDIYSYFVKAINSDGAVSLEDNSISNSLFINKVNFKALYMLKPIDFIHNVYSILLLNQYKYNLYFDNKTKTFILAQFAFLNNFNREQKENMLKQVYEINDKEIKLSDPILLEFYKFIFKQIEFNLSY